MKVRFLIALSLTCCAMSIAAQIAPPSLDGVVVDMGSNAPLQNATLELRGVSDSTKHYIAISTGLGQFVFRGVATGNYSLSVVRAGYLQIQYGQRGPNGSPATLMIPAGQRVSGIRLAMIRASAISGHVYDQDGAPAVNAQLHAWKISYNTGLRLAVPVTSQMTNDRGEYRLFGMPPGVYYISAQPEPPMHIRSPAYASRAPLIPGSILALQTGGMFSAVPDPAFARPGRQEWAPFYFGGTTDEYAATPIYLRAGTDLGGIDIIVNRLPVGRLAGTVIGPDGQPVPQASVIITPQGNQKFHAVPFINVIGGVMSISPAPPARSSQTGQFGVGSLAPGAYSLTAVLASPNGPRLSGQTSVAVQGTDVSNATIAMSPMFEIDGRIVVEGTSTANLSALSVRAVSTVNAIADTPKVSPSAAGTFKLVNVGRGSYVLDVTPLTPDSYVKSTRLGDVDVLNDGFRLDNPPDRPLEVVIGLKGGTIRGAVRDSSRPAIAGGITVALVPDESRRQRYELFRSATTDIAGRYEFRGISPGNYKVFAWEDIEPKSWMEPAYLRVFEDLGKEVAISEGSTEMVDVTAISPLER